MGGNPFHSSVMIAKKILSQETVFAKPILNTAASFIIPL
jgi:hypothetical protein